MYNLKVTLLHSKNAATGYWWFEVVVFVWPWLLSVISSILKINFTNVVVAIVNGETIKSHGMSYQDIMLVQHALCSGLDGTSILWPRESLRLRGNLMNSVFHFPLQRLPKVFLSPINIFQSNVRDVHCNANFYSCKLFFVFCMVLSNTGTYQRILVTSYTKFNANPFSRPHVTHKRRSKKVNFFQLIITKLT
jgi:hypothetical protein